MNNILAADKRKTVKALNIAGMENPSERATVNVIAVNMKELPDFIKYNTVRFFEISDLGCDFLQPNPALWEKTKIISL